jgi:hypothetical protein
VLTVACRCQISDGPRRRQDVAGGPHMAPGMGDYDVEHSHGMRVVHDGPRQAPPQLLIHGWGLRAPCGARWPGHPPTAITSSGSTFRGAANPRGRYFEKVTWPPWTGTSSIQVWPAGTSSL